MKTLLPAAYGVAGFYSVMSSSPTDCRDDYERALIDSAAQTLANDRVRRSRNADAELIASLTAELARMRKHHAKNLEALNDLLRLAPDDLRERLPAGSEREAMDLAELRAENKALRASLDWHVAQLAAREAS